MRIMNKVETYFAIVVELPAGVKLQVLELRLRGVERVSAAEEVGCGCLLKISEASLIAARLRGERTTWG